MDIIKRLQLNKNPKDIKSGSIVGAKNIMLDPISSSITSEYGFEVAFNSEEIKSLEGYKIVGSIPCNEELVIFLYNKYHKISKICKLNEKTNEYTYLDNWTWEGGKVFGTFAYNYKGELILAVSEILENSDKEIPLKIINFTRGICSNIEMKFPKFFPSYEINQNGNLVCGTYTFFIRFKVEENTYSKWVQLTDDIIIINCVEKEKPIHYFEGSTDNTLCNATTKDFKNIFVNTNLKSDKNIKLDILFDYDSDLKFKECQIGYIIKHNSDILGRILGDYNIDINSSVQINFDNNSFIEEVDIKEFLEEPHQFYNVKNLVTYNNRLYISNYSEYKKYTANDLSKLINSITLKFKNKVILDNNEKSSYKRTLNCELDGFSDYYNEELKTLSNNDTIEFFNNMHFYKAFKDEFYAVSTKLNNLKNTVPFLSPEDIRNYYTLGKAICYISNKDKTEFISIWEYDATTNKETWYNNFNINVVSDTVNLYKRNGSTDLNINLKDAYWALECISINNVDDRLSRLILQAGDTLGLKKSNYDNNSNYYNFSFTDIKTITNYRKIGTEYNNNRTLIPGQLYNLFVHFVRSDLSSTDGYKINIDTGIHDEITTVANDWTNFRTYKINGECYYYVPYISLEDKTEKYNENNGVIYIPQFSINKNYLKEKGFIGFFISYEKVERNIISIVPIKQYNSAIDKLDYIRYTNTELLYNSDTIDGNELKLFTTLEKSSSVDKRNNKVIHKINNILPYNAESLDISFEKSFSAENDINNNLGAEDRHALYKNTTNIYKYKVKTLYQLTPIAFIKSTDLNIIYTSEDNAYMYLPGFFNNEKVIIFSNNLIISASQSKVYNYDNDSKPVNSYSIKSYVYGTYSQLPLNAFSIKQDYDKAAITINNKVYSNSVLSPSKLKDFLEIKEAYVSLPVKTYTNYQESTITTFDKTIYRSDVISDESSYNGFRHFSIENYKNILENKGKIINIAGIGLYLLVHTEYSLFVFDRNNQLSNNAQLQIPDVFDIDYKELTPSNEGFGGLKNKDEAIVTKNGYIWFDRISKSILMFDGKQIKPLSGDIHNLIVKLYDRYNIKIAFAEDCISNRLIVCINCEIVTLPGLQRPIGSNNLYITLSYSFDTNTFISAHDYRFDISYKTYNNCYLFSELFSNSLYKYNRSIIQYKELNNNATNIFNELLINNNLCSYVDIIFNDLYEVPKTLNSLKYIISRDNYNYNTNIIDQYFNTDFDKHPHQNENKLYSGFRLYITSDLTFSEEIDISKSEEINALNTNKPYWDNGIWNFNWFRENINKDVTNSELKQQNVNNQTKEVYKQHDNLYKSGLEKSDMRSTINGKYFILRFVFERNSVDLNIKFETLDVNISKL